MKLHYTTKKESDFQDENSPLDYTGYHVNYILQDGWNGYGKLNLVVMIIMPILQYGGMDMEF